MRFAIACLGLFGLLAATPAPRAATPGPRPSSHATSAPRPAGTSHARAGATFQPGVYRQIDTVTKKLMPVGNQIVIIAGKDGKLGFSVSAIRQLDANQGFIAGTLPATLPATWTKTSDAGNCKLLFEAAPNGFNVTQDSAFGDCGFGGGVSAGGAYELTEKS